jgi:farnesyl diphosphate synthase
MTNFTQFCEDTRPIISTTLSRYLSEKFPFTAQNKLQEAMAYSTLSTSKQYRPLLTIATHSLFSDSIRDILPLAAAIEMIHTYSLIHDDLPAMDNDTLRRGKPTCHIQFDEATAILAGDTLQCLAFEILATHLPDSFSAKHCLKAISYLCQSLGVDGMAGGQQMDIDAPKNTDITHPKDYLIHMHQLKTGALIKSCIVIPGILNQADPHTMAKLSQFASHLGLLFQIADDILDTNPHANLGKTSGKDTDQNKLTYIQLFGLETAQKIATTEAVEAKKCLESLPFSENKLSCLSDFVDFTINRNS